MQVEEGSGGPSSLGELGQGAQLPTFWDLSCLLWPQPVFRGRGKNSKATQDDKCKVMQ